MKPDISIIIVNYNSGRFLYDCLASIADNIHVSFEVIVADNASTDSSLDICRPFRPTTGQLRKPPAGFCIS